VKRCDLERHLRACGCRLVDDGGYHSKWGAAEDARRSVAGFVVPVHGVDFGWWAVSGHQNALLVEHRQGLITAAVTGHIPIADAA
jgi:hypothetical protein